MTSHASSRDATRCRPRTRRASAESQTLYSLRVGVTESGTTISSTITHTSRGTTPCLQWRDVLVLDRPDNRCNAGIVKGLQEAGIPVRVMKDDDIDDVATSRSDVVWVADGYRVRGLERKVVVCLEDLKSDLLCSVRLNLMSRCTSQLVIVSPKH